MNQTVKRTLALLLMLALTLPLAACGEKAPAPGAEAPAPAADRDTVVATVGSYEVKRGDMMDTYASIVQSYQYFGQAAPTDAASIEQMQDGALEELVGAKMMYYQGELMGLYPLTEEQAAEVAAETEANVAELMDSFTAYAEEEGAEDLAARAAEMIDEALAANGWGIDFEGYKDWLAEYNTTVKLTELVKEKVESEAVIDEETYHNYYDELLAAQREKYAATPEEYLHDAEDYEMYGASPVLVAPEGFVRVKAIVFEPGGTADENYDAKLSEMAELEAEYGALALSGEEGAEARLAELREKYALLAAETNEMRKSFFGDASDKAAEALKKLSEGADFDETLLSYGSDKAYATYEAVGQKGRLMALSGDDGWDDKLHQAVEALSDGAHSDIIETDGALYIIQRVGAEPAAAVAYETAKPLITALAETEAKEALWAERQAEWLADESVVTYFEDAYRDIGK